MTNSDPGSEAERLRRTAVALAAYARAAATTARAVARRTVAARTTSSLPRTAEPVRPDKSSKVGAATPDREIARIAAYAGAAAVAAAAARSEDIVACHDATRLAAIRGFAQSRAWQSKLAAAGVDPAQMTGSEPSPINAAIEADLDFDRIAEDTLDAAAGVELTPVPRSEFGSAPDRVTLGRPPEPVSSAGRVVEFERTRSPEVELEAW